MTHHDPDGPLIETAQEVRQGPKGRRVLWVLIAGLILAVIALAFFMMTNVENPPPSIGVTPDQGQGSVSTPATTEPAPADPATPVQPPN